MTAFSLRPRLALLATLALLSTAASATDIARIPLAMQVRAQPNVIFGMDNAGSMDYELLLTGTSDGAFWWNSNPRALPGGSNGAPVFGGSGNGNGSGSGSGSGEGGSGSGMSQYSYLFPNGCSPAGAGRRQYCDRDGDGHFAIAPTTQFAALRSSAYNPLFYDPARTYRPWAPGTVAGTLRRFADADPAAAATDPLAQVAMALNVDTLSTDSNTTFHMVAGMVVPAGALLYDAARAAWVTVDSTFTVPAVAGAGARLPTTPPMAMAPSFEMAIRWFPATYWLRATCTVNTIDCATAPDGATLQRYQIRPGTAPPSGRTYADELQNFANWFSYHRKRRFMLGAAVGEATGSLSGVRVGVVDFNDRAPATMYDTDSTDTGLNGSMLSGHFYANHGGGATPTRETLKYIGDQFARSGVIMSSCQRNAAVIVTSGYANSTRVVPPSYDAGRWGRGAPYATSMPGSLADIALSYYTNNPRPELPPGLVQAAAADDPRPASDKNRDLHVNTYAITLGATGRLWPARTDAYAGGAIAWPDPAANSSADSIDDLWHATLNGRGSMLRATNPDQTTAAIGAVIGEIVGGRAAQSGVAFGNPVLSAADSMAYVGSFDPGRGSGDVSAHRMDAATGAVTGAALWSADAMLNAADWRRRKVISFDGRVGVPFDAANIGGQVASGLAFGPAAPLVDYLRGDRSNEGAAFRPRSGLMGPDLNAEPVVDRLQGIVYGVTNEGMVHAFDKTNGQELWAYVPGFTLTDIGAQSQPGWLRQGVLDATPTLATAGTRRLLVGGRGRAGAGFYALDVGPTRGLGEGQLASHVLWEFPNAASTSAQSTATQIRASIGASMGKPLVVHSARFGWVVLLTSGYNTHRDGKGRLFVLDAVTGAVRAEIVTPAGSPGAGDAGLAQVASFAEPGGDVRTAYGGDLLGNLWRFDIDAGSVQRLASLVDVQGMPLPVTATPELGTDSGRRMVYVGTGRLLGSSDLADVRSVNAVFAIADDGSIGGDLRPRLAPRTISFSGTSRNVAGIAVDWRTQRGWVVDLPPGEKADTDPVLALGVLSWTTNQPSLSACDTQSFLYVASPASGLALPATAFTNTAWFGVRLASNLASRAVLARLADGSLVVVTQQSDASITQQHLLAPAPTTAVKAGWREIRR